MATSPHDPNTTKQDELLFASLIDDIANRMRAGERISWERLYEEYPLWYSQIQELMPMIGMLSKGPNTIGSHFQDHPSAAEGTQIGDFRILRKVGKGGMGEVYEAYDTTLQRRVALKLLPYELAENDRARVRFENEAMAAARLKHPHIVPVFSVGQVEGTLYYCMPFIEGITLGKFREEIKSRARDESPGPFPLPCTQEYYHQVACIGRDIALALHAAHEAGVIHRDIKPSNILLEPDGHVWVVDFGLAYLENQKTLTESGEIVGTLRYMSPERLTSLDHSRIDRRADIYSIGATLYELLTLEPPFAENPQSTLYRAITTASPTPIRKLVPAIPEGLARIVEKAMERDPRDRYQDGLDLAADLRRFLDGESVVAKRTRFATHAVRYLQAKPFRFVGAAILMAVLFASSLVVMSWRRELSLVRDANSLQEQLLIARDEELRATELFLSINRTREQREQPHAGWREGNLKELNAVAAKANDEAERLLVRNEIAATLKQRDLVATQTLLDSSDIYCCQWSPDGSHLAVGLNLAEDDKTSLILFSGPSMQQQRRICLPSPKMLGEDSEDTMGVRALLFSVDGKTLFCSSRVGMLHAVDVATGQVTHSLRRDDGAILALTPSPDGTQLATGSTDGWLRICDSRTFAVIHQKRIGSKVSRIFWRESELVLLTGHLYRLSIDEEGLGEPQPHYIEGSHVECAATIHAGLGIVLPAPEGLQIINSTNGKPVRTLRFANRDVESAFENSSAFCLSPDADVLFSSNRSGITLWDYASGDPELQLPLRGNSPNGVASHPHAPRIAVWGEEQLKLYEIPCRTGFGTSQGSLHPITTVALETYGSMSPLMADIRLMHLPVPSDHAVASFTTVDHKDAFPQARFQWECNQRATLGGGWFACWGSVLDHVFLHRLEPPQHLMCNTKVSGLRWMALSQDGRTLFLAIDELIPGKQIGIRSRPVLQAHSTQDGSMLWEWRDQDNLDPEEPTSLMDAHAIGDDLICLFEDSRIRKFDILSGEVTWSVHVPMLGGQTFCELSTDLYAVGTRTGNVGIFNAASLRMIGEAKFHARQVNSIRAMTDGTVISAGGDGTLVFSKAREETMHEVLRLNYANASIDQFHFHPEAQLAFLRCRGEHLGRWIQIDKLREEFTKLKIDWR
jgi:serine/threonine protein kinase